MGTLKTLPHHESEALNAVQQRLRDDIRVAEAKTAARLRRFPYYATIESASHSTIMVDGEPLINLGSNNYLGLATDPRVIEAATDATRLWGTGVTGSRLLNGTLSLHESLEATLCSFYEKEAALVFPTGYTANLGLISGTLQPGDIIAVDREIHASLFDALMLSRAPFRRFEHNSVDGARNILTRGDATRARALVLEGVYSMQGDVPPLAQFAALAGEVSAFLIV
ncbi:MAG: aminotransferase class I/II-fold pyridoxal phosphate-dependent enzyme, partial [Alphaproteobacteria bacterium]|nr:aminotransferase class I/II-fold pyridoxal phosphate-dependent enzyme [Alphaproteobacteria bacterium]